MPYDYKRKQDCRQSDDSKGTYVTKKSGAGEQKCWKSKSAFERAQAARHAQAEADDIAEEDTLTELLLKQYIRQVLK
tara:strand:- start:2586 stop:2816 length:231 start_codon:yes stop_codon:yes gene_type:complete